MIELKQVHKSFDQPVLKGLSLSVERGCLFGLVGPAAAGKTLTLKLIAGLVRPDRGSIRVEGREITELSEIELSELRRRVGMMFQNSALFDFMTVADNVAFPLRRLLDLPESEIQRRVAERLERVALDGFEERLPPGLSGGQRRRVGVARATVSGAPLLLCDEPAAGLDPVTSQRIFELLREEQRASNATVVVVSSDVDRLLSITDRLGLLYQGTLVFQGTPEEAKKSHLSVVKQFLDGVSPGPL